jgi:hypothetical protein
MLTQLRSAFSREYWFGWMGQDVEAAKCLDLFWFHCYTFRLLLIYPLSLMRRAPGIESKVGFWIGFALGALYLWPLMGIYEILLARDIKILGDGSRGWHGIIVRLLVTSIPIFIFIWLPDSEYDLGLVYYAILFAIGTLTGWYYLINGCEQPVIPALARTTTYWPTPKGWQWSQPGEREWLPHGGWVADDQVVEAPIVADWHDHTAFILPRYTLSGYLLLKSQG